MLGTYGRVRGTRANEKQLDILERRIASGEAGPDMTDMLARAGRAPGAPAASPRRKG